MDKIKVYPLIYSRTLLADYVKGFLVRPKDLDVPTALTYVAAALENIKYTDGVRHAVFPAGDYFVYGGATCVASRLVERISSVIDFSYKGYQADKAGRPLIFFIGFAIRKEDLPKHTVPKVDLYDTYKIYLDYLRKQWNDSTTSTEFTDGIELPSRLYSNSSGSHPEQFLSYHGKTFLKRYSEQDYQQYIDYFFTKMVNDPTKDYSFISDILPDDIDSRLPFANVSVYGCTAEECIARLRSKSIERQERTSSDIQSFPRTKTPDIIKTVKTDSTEKKNNSNNRDGQSGLKDLKYLGVILAIIIVLLLIFLFAPKKKPMEAASISTEEIVSEEIQTEEIAAEEMASEAIQAEESTEAMASIQEQESPTDIQADQEQPFPKETETSV